MKKELSVFIDESGDFGEVSHHAPYYIVTLVLHEQSNSIAQDISTLDDYVSAIGFPKHAIHTGPIIRRESIYEDDSIDDRRHLFSGLFNFVRKAPIRYKTIKVKKSECPGPVDFAGRLSRGVADAIREDLDYFHSFDEVIVYYDNGQIELTRILTAVFHSLVSNVSFRKVSPTDYKLFQAADLICTLELLVLKLEDDGFTRSETQFFGNARDFRKSFYKPILKKRM